MINPALFRDPADLLDRYYHVPLAGRAVWLAKQ
jgi:hypothetical protein